MTRLGLLIARWLGFLISCALAASGVARAGGEAIAAGSPPELRPERISCVLCREDPPVPIVRLTSAMAESVGRRIHERNAQELLKIDRLYSQGRFGGAGSEAARKEALRRFKVRALNAMDYLDRLARVEDKVYEFGEDDIAGAFQDRFVNPGVYPFLTLEMGRAGLGAFCLSYGFDEGYRRRYRQYGQEATLTAETVRLDRDQVPMLRLEYPSGLHSTIELLYEPSYCGQVFRREVVDRGDTLELITVEAMEGCYVRKAGLHRIAGFAFWRNLRSGARCPRVGSAAYLPAIHLRLPFFLPDIGFDDLREFDLPQPLWEQGFLQETRKWPDWLPMRESGAIERWDAEGPMPEILNTLFPDL